MEPFICVKCGSCCKSFKENKEELSIKGKIIELTKPSLFIFDWEKGFFPEDSLMPGSCAFDMKNNTLIILNYALKSSACPNTKDNICLIYENRPLTCRFYPCPLHDIEKDNKIQSAFGLCKAELPTKEIIKWLGNSTREEARRKFHFRYGDGFIYGMISNILLENYASFLSQLEKQGIVSLATDSISLDELNKRVKSSKSIGISELFFKFNNKHLHKMLLSDESISYLRKKLIT